MSKQIKVALIGNPNTGKTSIFNSLTGLNQKIANYPGVTVEKKEGICRLSRGTKAHIFDLPGNNVRLIQQAPFQGPIYLEVNGSYVAIRKETAKLIEIELSK